jgi:hypothetical protein
VEHLPLGNAVTREGTDAPEILEFADVVWYLLLSLLLVVSSLAPGQPWLG